jgi:5-methylcytosine-specific restriction enzyme subunit McrC
MKEEVNMSGGIITLFEDRKTKVDLSRSQINDILFFKRILGNQCIRIDYDGSIQIMHYVGFLSRGNTRVQILPKIYEKAGIKGEDEIKESTRVLYNLLRVSDYNKVLHLPENIKSSLGQIDFLEIFIGIFADRIYKTYSTKMNREYLEIEENSAFIKGKICFQKTMKHNLLRRDLHYVNYQSFEHDNAINNVVKTVAIRLLKYTRDPENRKNLKKALMFLDDAKQIELSLPLIQSVKFTRLNIEFESVFNMAKMFYLNMQPENFAGEESIFSFLIPVNDLYEHYLYKLFSEIDGYSAKHEDVRSFAVTCEGINILRVKPDILVYNKNKIVLVADAKYKNPCFDKGNYNNINRDDIYQVFAYAKVYGIKKTALIYPLFDDIPTPKIRIILRDDADEIELNILCVDIKKNNFEEVKAQLIEELL